MPVSLAAEPVPPVAEPTNVQPWLMVGTVVVSYLPTTVNVSRSPAACVGRVGLNAVTAPGAPVVTPIRLTDVGGVARSRRKVTGPHWLVPVVKLSVGATVPEPEDYLRRRIFQCGRRGRHRCLPSPQGCVGWWCRR